MKISLELHEQVGFRLYCPSLFGGTTIGLGNSTHLGNVSFKGNDCITQTENYFTFKGRFMLTTANDDMLLGIYGGSFVPIDNGPMYSISDATFKIIGGTGRFALARLVKSPGVALPPDEAVTPEAVAAHWAEIENLAGAKPHRNAISAVGASFEVE